jgi:O-antigen/teichoic acid export membrane protein
LKVTLNESLQLLWNEKVFFFSLCIISLYTNTNIVVLGIIQGSTEVGYYTAGQKLISIIQMVITVPLAQAVFPYLSKEFRINYESGIEMAQKIIPVVFAFTFLTGVIIILCSPLFINLLYGSSFKPAVHVCRILAFIPMIISLGTILGVHIMLNLKMDQVFFRCICVGAISSIMLNVISIKFMGYLGSALTWTITELINLILLFFSLKAKKIQVVNMKYLRPKYYITQVSTLTKKQMTH